MSSKENLADRFINFIGKTCSILMIALILIVFLEVVMRYFFNLPSNGRLEFQWHLFSIIFLLGMSYGLKENSHVRVDVFFEKFTDKEKAYVDFMGLFFLVLPVSIVIFYYSYDFVMASYLQGERSMDPGGLPYRFIIKAFVPISFLLLILQSLNLLLKNYKKLIHLENNSI